ncbi:hypothetical protein [Chryseobacterium scophthalmum]|uniref:Type I restriction enzyme R protein N terminus (HSDR_N) n=1 Tax=Chryseobacterium scophthalmum TaxID=59733 RepID=A0A1N6IN46_9FLAO|nr:hypothetical protein [Chryseobacterium scophthalmum]SIO33407.1 hypothetical protein SAMN05421769_3590 [Chryseobacterium scophthalmum]
MQDEFIIEKIENSLKSLIEKDYWLIEKDLSEQSICHKLALYIQNEFNGYDLDIDCEYNGDITRDNERKSISILKSELKALKLLKEKEENDLEKEYTNRAVFPDIIIHKRGSLKYNLCIIEVKKSSSNIPFVYDDLKLKSYTSEDYDNNLDYQIGVFVKIIVGTKPSYTLKYYKHGQEMNIPN